MILSTIVLLPLLFALVISLVPMNKWIRPMALGFSVLEFLLSLLVLFKFDSSSKDLQMVEQYAWLHRIDVSYFFGVDGISLWLVLLTTFLLPVVILGSWTTIQNRVRGFHACLFVLQTAMLGAFLAMDAIFFYLFWELTLVPMLFLIGIWGGPRKIYATVKFFVYTMAGSVLMLIGIIYLMLLTKDQLVFQAGGENYQAMSASLLDFYKLHIPFVQGDFLSPQSLLFWAFALAFMIKIPIFPFHTWQPDAYSEAPTPATVLMSGVLLKMGTYGFLRWVLPLFPEAATAYTDVFMTLGVISIIYGALLAMVQTDLKRLVAYSSISHMGYVVIGIFALNEQSVNGSIFQMLSHGITIAAVFLVLGMLAERVQTREIKKISGAAAVFPLLAIAMFVSLMASISVPTTNGFVGEFLILLGSFAYSPWFAGVATLGVILSSVYMLWMYKRVFFGEKSEMFTDAKAKFLDLNYREIAVISPLVILIFWMGLFPGSFLSWTKASVDHLITNRGNYELSVLDVKGEGN